MRYLTPRQKLIIDIVRGTYFTHYLIYDFKSRMQVFQNSLRRSWKMQKNPVQYNSVYPNIQQLHNLKYHLHHLKNYIRKRRGFKIKEMDILVKSWLLEHFQWQLNMCMKTQAKSESLCSNLSTILFQWFPQWSLINWQRSLSLYTTLMIYS